MERIAVADPDALARVTAALDAGDLCVVPTDTEYVLAADALNDDAVLRAFDARRRAADAPLSVCVGSFGEVHHVAHQTPLARALADAFWPGPLKLVLKARPWLPDELTAGGPTVAVRCPDLAFGRDLARRFGPYVATRAGRASGAPATSVDEARAQLGSDVRLYVDGGALPGARTTVVDATGAEAKVLREGAIPASEIAAHGPRGD